jgi:hypothetical protein
VLATWARIVVPSSMSLRGPDMSLDMRLLTVSGESGFGHFQIHGCGLERPTWLKRGGGSS